MIKVFLRLYGAAIVANALSLLGALWLLLKVTLFAWPETTPFISRAVGRIPWMVFLLSLAGATAAMRPRMSILCHLDERDLDIEVMIGDMFAVDGDYVVSTNTTFDTSFENGLITPESVQGQFTRRFFSSASHLDADIDRALQAAPSKLISVPVPRKSRRYPVGTVAKVPVRPGLRHRVRFAYLVALAELSSGGTPQSSFDMLQEALAGLWVYINEQGETGRVVTALLGSGRARVPVSQERILREIVDSFVACSAERKVCERLTIVIRPADYLRNHLSLIKMARYLDHIKEYGPFADPGGPGSGGTARPKWRWPSRFD